MKGKTKEQEALEAGREQAEEQIRKLSRAVEQSPSTVVITDTDGNIEYVNPKFAQLTGYTTEEAMGKNPRILQSGKTPPEVYEELWKTITSGNEWRGEFCNKKKNGELYWEDASISPVKDAEGVITHYVAVKEDITARKQLEEELKELNKSLEQRVAERTAELVKINEELRLEIAERKRLSERLDYVARYDVLTGLPNRIMFVDLLGKAMARASRKKQQAALLLVHPGGLDGICRTLGHEACDSLLPDVAKRLTDGVRRYDDVARLDVEEDAVTVGRTGEFEFAVLLSEIASARDAAHVAERILAALSKLFVVEGNEFYTTSSIGIAVYPPDGDSAEVLLKNATFAISHMKDVTKSDFKFYSPSMSKGVTERMSLENDLRRALEREELIVHYQPQVDLHTGKIAGMEALVRWQHPDRGLVSPAEFILLAEETGLIVPLGEWVLRTACTQKRKWYDMGLLEIYVSVNFSVHQFRQQNVVGTIKKVTKETSIDPHYLELEITESALVKDKGVTASTLNELKEMGIQISIDDFGTGYSSLSYLRQLPISKLKVDQSFVRDLTIHPDNDAIVTATIAMAHSLGMKVIAEGVETEKQLEFLRALKCDEMQGYLFSKPLPAEEATKLLAEGRRLKL